MRPLLAILVLLLAAASVGQRVAHAHAVLVETRPADRAELADPPQEIVLRFNEPVRPVALRVLDANGASVALGRVSARDRELRVPIRGELPTGIYIASWRVTSTDSHPVGGSFLFAVGTALSGAPANMQPRSYETFWDAAVIIVRALQLAGLLLSVGGVLYALLVTRNDAAAWERVRPVALPSSIAALVVSLAAIGVQGGALAGLPPPSLLDWEPWRLGMASSRGDASLAAAAGMALIACSVARARRFRGTIAAIGAACALVSTAMSGHAAAAPASAFFLPLFLLHVSIAAFWIGSLPALRGALREAPDTSLGPLRRFSAVAVIAVPVLLIAGAAMALVQIGDWAALTEAPTRYGIVLALKLGLVALLLGLAGWNRLVLTPALARGEAGADTRLRRIIGTELVAAFAILAVTAVLSQSVPPRAAARMADHDHASAPSYSAYVQSQGGNAVIEVAPARAGQNAIAVGIVDREGRRVTPIEVRVELSSPALGIEPVARKMRPTPGGGFSHVGPEFSVPGMWRLRIDALITDFDKLVFEAEVPIGPASDAAR